MRIKTGKLVEYSRYKAKNRNVYSRCIVEAGEAYAEALEPRLSAGESLAEIARSVFAEVDARPRFRITDFMYGAMMQGLATYWEHGEELRRWHNLDSQIGREGEKANEGDGVLNPALLCPEEKPDGDN